MISISFKKTFHKQFQKVSSKDKKYIFRKLELFQNESDNLDIKKLKPKEKNYFRLRVGKYRLIYTYISEVEVVFLKIDKRDRVYFNVI